MQTVTVQDAVAALPLLQAAIPHLNASRQSFALDLIHYHARKNKLTPGQAPWVGKLIDMAADAMEPTDADAAVDLADVTAVKAFFDRARCHLKAPAVLIQVPDVGLVRVYIGKENARRFAGKMVVGDEWGQKPYPWVAKTYGLITDDGKFEPRKGVETPAGLLDVLTDFAADPVKYARAYGQFTGKCCFCRLPLTDPRSTAQGYGETCADHFGLPWGERPAEGSVFLAVDTSPDQGTLDLTGLPLDPADMADSYYQEAHAKPQWEVSWTHGDTLKTGTFQGTEAECRAEFGRRVMTATTGAIEAVILHGPDGTFEDTWGT
jgi:hypothetical protein